VAGFITYAQNFEDVMLWRALHAVDAGFYIDVGAADPDEDSVTRAFYDHGWRGVNIEPSPGHFAALASARPRDINLCCLVGVASGEMNLFNIPDTGLSTVEQHIADRHAADGRPSDMIKTPVRTLADICTEFAPQAIHFVKIDVEGAEAEVLRGADFATFRPWIVVVEATEPLSQTENWQGWEPLLIEASYDFVWFDGLNRFYLAAERTDALRHAFRLPPNYFDFWIQPRGRQQRAILDHARAVQDAMQSLRDESAQGRGALEAAVMAARSEVQAGRMEVSAVRAEISVATAKARVARMEASAAQRESAAAQAEAVGLRAEVVTLQKTVDAAQHKTRATDQARVRTEARMAALLASTSWRITLPLRAVSSLVGGDLLRRRRLARVAGLGHQSNGAKGLARVATYGLGRAAARLPGARTISRAAGFLFPGPHRWLHTRYALYRRLARVAGLGHQSGGAKGLARVATYGLGRAAARLPGGRTVFRAVGFLFPGPHRWLHTRYALYRRVAGSPYSLDELARSSEVFAVEATPTTLDATSPIYFAMAAEEQAMLLRLRVRRAAS
jgi:FkbM family methyltransferase